VICSQSVQVDLDTYLVAPDAPEHLPFTSHARGCEECLHRIHLWANLWAAPLQPAQDATLEHPDPARMAVYLRSDVDALSKREIEAHLKSCASCRDELTSLRTGAWRTVDAPRAVPRAEPSPDTSHWLTRIRRRCWR